MQEKGSRIGVKADKLGPDPKGLGKYCREEYKRILRTKGVEEAAEYRRNRRGVRERALLEEQLSKLHLQEALSSDQSAISFEIQPEDRLVELDSNSYVVDLEMSSDVHAWQSVTPITPEPQVSL